LVIAIRKLFAAYGAEAQLTRAQVYCEHLADLPLEQVEGAIAHAIRTGGDFLPTISALRGIVAEAACKLPGVDEAWAEVMRQVRRVGRYRSPSWSSPSIAAAVDGVGGWQAICNAENEGIIRAHFARAYEASRGRAVESEQLGEVAGLLRGIQRRALPAGGAK
jgi:hypothetical protein